MGQDNILQQNIDEKAGDTMLIAQLLFCDKPAMAESTKLQTAFEKIVGQVEKISKAENKDTPMFAVKKYEAAWQDAPKPITPLACFLGPMEFKSDSVDAMKRSQLWDMKDGVQIIDSCCWMVTVCAMLERMLPYRQRIELLLAETEAALEMYPECKAVYIPASGKLTAPESFRQSKEQNLTSRFFNLFLNVRFFNIQDSDAKVVDSLGLYALGLPDVQVHFRELEPNAVVRHVYDIAAYQCENNVPINSGETLDGIGENGEVDQNIQWKVQYENALIQPVREVLDINCGKFAAGNRS